MRAVSKRKNKNDSVFVYVLLLTSFFFLLEISFFIQSNKMYLGDFTAVSDTLLIPKTILPGIVFFLFAQVLVHLGYSIVVWLISLSLVTRLKIQRNDWAYWGMGVWLWGLITVLVANQYFYPNSKFSELTSLIFIHPTVTKIALVLFFIPCCAAFFLTGMTLILMLSKRWLYLSISILITTAAIFFFLSSPLTPYSNPATHEKPNIILIGVDSLRPDFLSHFGRNNPTPFFDSFVASSTVFKQALTPLARTFPSWTSILTGQYPLHTGIRFNLAQQAHHSFTQSLPALLQGQGYETLYATDETRFSNIDTNFGFDRIITPPMGLNDFLLGTFNDFPLSNLLVNTVVGKWLFPHSYANRPVYFTYDPNSFINLMRPALQEQRNKPLFLAVHFCLAHHPYLWADFSGNKLDVVQRYEASVSRVDKQVQDFFNVLKKNGLLDHAMVILLSDHGEALELHGDRITKNESFIPAKQAKVSIPKFYPPSLDDEAIDQSAGHGTDVLGLTQYYSLLAFKLYGLGEQQKKVVMDTVSLLDIKPTLLALLNMKPESSPAGISLLATIKGKETTSIPINHIFLETDFTPEAIRTVYPETRKVVLEGVRLYQIDELTTRLTFKASMSEMVIKSKQYADVYGDWILALYPQSQSVRTPILVNLKTGEWTNDLRSRFAQHSPAADMLIALKSFYGDEIDKTL